MSHNKVSGPVVPGSEHIPFRPFNPHGKAPEVRRANGTVADWKNPLAVDLYQVYVLDSERGTIPIGPKAAMDVCDQLLSAVKLAIKAGQIHGWASPTLVKIGKQRAVSRLF